YVFEEYSYPGIPKIEINQIDLTPFILQKNLTLIPIQVFHHKLPVLGFRFGDFTYITDAKTISEEEINKVKGTKTLIINALHRNSHVSHFNLEEALRVIEEINPEKAYLTHISHLFGKQEDIQKELPKNIFVAYDGLKLPFAY
ncbi:MAG: MBL fold metallo-hydrolase, partial [Flavobacteriia bacterium]|nr:MBL fold metallo-hydrolase [Flavobacteriia bacterium]